MSTDSTEGGARSGSSHFQDVKMQSAGGPPILTLEPLVDAIQSAAEACGWELSGMQKTTSHQFEGRWEGDSTRSAYLFFHRKAGPAEISIDVYLDETTRGLTGNLALVVDLEALGRLGDVERVLAVLAEASAERIPATYRRPVTLRFRLPDAGDPAAEAESEVRFKVRLPRDVIAGGAAPVMEFTTSVATDFSSLLDADVLDSLREGE